MEMLFMALADVPRQEVQRKLSLSHNWTEFVKLRQAKIAGRGRAPFCKPIATITCTLVRVSAVILRVGRIFLTKRLCRNATRRFKSVTIHILIQRATKASTLEATCKTEHVTIHNFMIWMPHLGPTVNRLVFRNTHWPFRQKRRRILGELREKDWRACFRLCTVSDPVVTMQLEA